MFLTLLLRTFKAGVERCCTIPAFYTNRGFVRQTHAKVRPRCAQQSVMSVTCMWTCVCLCLCVCLQFSRIWSAFMWIIITLWRFFFPPFLTTTSAAEANSRGRVEAKLSASPSFSSLRLFLFLSASALSLSPPLFSLLPSVAHLPPWPGPPTLGALGGPRTIAISASVLKRPIMTST